MNRRVFDHELFEGEPYSRRDAWLYLISICTWEGEKAGCFAASERELAKIWNWERAKVHRFLKSLTHRNMIEPLSDPDPIRQCAAYRTTNFKQYQNVKTHSDPPDDPAVKQKRSTQRSTPINKDINKLNTTNNKIPLPELPVGLDTPALREALGNWLEHKRERREPYTGPGLKALVGKLAKWGPTRAIAAIEHSMSGNYQGIFEESRSGFAAKPEPKRAHPPLMVSSPRPQVTEQRTAVSLLKQVTEKIAEQKA